ncbi:MAG: hypothetical protein O2779_05755, partial [Nanoarchaeota archaeon]|nr:hypothetical protein [Nanoarchaeota archaeon]
MKDFYNKRLNEALFSKLFGAQNPTKRTSMDRDRPVPSAKPEKKGLLARVMTALGRGTVSNKLAIPTEDSMYGRGEIQVPQGGRVASRPAPEPKYSRPPAEEKKKVAEPKVLAPGVRKKKPEE